LVIQKKDPSPIAGDCLTAEGDRPNEGLGEHPSKERIGEPGDHDEGEIETHMIVAPSTGSSDSERGSVEAKHIESAD